MNHQLDIVGVSYQRDGGARFLHGPNVLEYAPIGVTCGVVTLRRIETILKDIHGGEGVIFKIAD